MRGMIGRGCVVFAVLLSMGTAVSAETLVKELEILITDHKRIRSAEAALESARESAEASFAGWHPNLSVTTGYGYENQIKGNDTDDTGMPPRTLSATVEQLLWDFGSTDADIERAELAQIQARYNLVATRQSLILEAATAYLDLMRQYQLTRFAKASVENIKRQAELEDSRVQRGRGFSTDVLQAKTQLAGAESRLTRAMGALRIAKNRYRAVFGHEAAPETELSVPQLPLAEFPGSLDEAIAIALENNPGLDATSYDVALAKADVKKTKAEEYFPEVNAIARQTMDKDADGTTGTSNETLFKVELTYDLSLGLTAANTLRASQQTQVATENRYGDARDVLEEQVRNAWDNLETARINVGHLKNQANIAAEFLDLARKERTLGKRSLIDVLAGETALINANSDAASAETDVAIAVYSLLAAMGRLELSIWG